MNTETKFHTREHYETVFIKLLEQASREAQDMCAVNVSLLSNLELLVQINNLLIYFHAEPFSLDEIESIVYAIDKHNKRPVAYNVVKHEPIEKENGVFNVDDSGNWLTKEKRQALKKSLAR